MIALFQQALKKVRENLKSQTGQTVIRRVSRSLRNLSPTKTTNLIVLAALPLLRR